MLESGLDDIPHVGWSAGYCGSARPSSRAALPERRGPRLTSLGRLKQPPPVFWGVDLRRQRSG